MSADYYQTQACGSDGLSRNSVTALRNVKTLVSVGGM